MRVNKTSRNTVLKIPLLFNLLWTSPMTDVNIGKVKRLKATQVISKEPIDLLVEE